MKMSLTLPALRRHDRGFTLIEILIVIAIVGLLARIAYPAYMNSVSKARRADAKSALLDLAQREERYMAQYNTYSDVGTALGYANDFPITVMSGSKSYYTIAKPTLMASSGTTVAAFSATATATGTQASDACKDYTLTSAGVQQVSGIGASPNDCW